MNDALLCSTHYVILTAYFIVCQIWLFRKGDAPCPPLSWLRPELLNAGDAPAFKKIIKVHLIAKWTGKGFHHQRSRWCSLDRLAATFGLRESKGGIRSLPQEVGTRKIANDAGLSSKMGQCSFQISYSYLSLRWKAADVNNENINYEWKYLLVMPQNIFLITCWSFPCWNIYY